MRRCYSIMTRNIRQRRGSKPTANVPIYFDTHTPRPFHDPTIPLNRHIYPEDRGKSSYSNLAAALFIPDAEAREGAAKPNHIYLDALGFGGSCCCLQVTFQAADVLSARRAYDALVPVAPILVSLVYPGVKQELKMEFGIDGVDRVFPCLSRFFVRGRLQVADN